MRQRRAGLAIVILAALTICLHGWPAFLWAQDRFADMEPVAILLPQEVVVDDSLVMLGQIAQLRGGPTTLRQRLARLDVAEFKLDTSRVIVTREQIGYRILLAGISASNFQLNGAARAVVVESDQPATARKILAAAEQSLRARFSGADTGVCLTAHKGFDVPSILLHPGEKVRFAAKIKAPGPRAGQATVEVALTVNGKTREVVPVSFDIVQPEAPPVKTAKNTGAIRPAVYTTSILDGRDVVIKARDNVKLIANIGAARIEAVGEAQQDGYVGQVIRVRNVDSNRIVHGRVDDSGAVVVEY